MLKEQLGPEHEVVDSGALERAVECCRDARIALPTFAQLADPSLIPERITSELAHVGPDESHPLNLFRVHWFNDKGRTGLAAVPDHVVLPRELTGVDAKIVVALGDRFPLIRAHKVLAAYGCLAPSLVTGRFDPTRDRAVWPSTGNYCRGGVAISRLMGCRGVAVLPEGMSSERFEWLDQWVADPDDVIRTPGTESNVKEIYDKLPRARDRPGERDLQPVLRVRELRRPLPGDRGRAGTASSSTSAADEPGLRLRAFVSATGSAGTIAAGDYLKERLGSLIVAGEALECPTMLRNGFGEHNIQGIGDKHIPLIHNVLNTDLVVAVSERATDRLGLLFGTDVGRRHLAARRRVPEAILDELPSLGLSSICNVLGAIKTAKHYDLGPQDVIVTVATDGAAMYASERELALAKYFGGEFDEVAAAEVFGEHLLGATTDNLRELTHEERGRIFNLGYFTWVEQQGTSIDDFQARRNPAFWAAKQSLAGAWDEAIDEFNARTGVLAAL